LISNNLIRCFSKISVQLRYVENRTLEREFKSHTLYGTQYPGACWPGFITIMSPATSKAHGKLTISPSRYVHCKVKQGDCGLHRCG